MGYLKWTLAAVGLRALPYQNGPPRVVFTGTLGYPPNSQGIRWFVDEGLKPQQKIVVTGAQQLLSEELKEYGAEPP